MEEIPTLEDQPSIDSQVSYLWGAAFIKAVDSLLKDFFFQHEAHLRLHVRIGNVYLHGR